MALQKINTNNDTYQDWLDKINLMIDYANFLSLATDEEFNSGNSQHFPTVTQVRNYLDTNTSSLSSQITQETSDIVQTAAEFAMVL